MRPRRAALLTPPSLTPAFLQNVANSCICHTSEKSPVTPIIATDPKTRSRKSCVCHTCDPLPPPPFHVLLLSLLSCESKISMLSFKNPLMKVLDSTFVPRIRRSRVRGFPHSSGTVSCELSTVDSAKSFRMRSSKQTPCFARFWPKLSVRNFFRMRTYEKEPS